MNRFQHFFRTLHERNPGFHVFGWIHVFIALGCLVALPFWEAEVLGISSLIKPIKFFVSTAILCWTMGWIMTYLKMPGFERFYTWLLILAFGLENSYILGMALQGQLSHFNTSSAAHMKMFTVMGVVISVVVVFTAFVLFLFLRKKLPQLSRSYLWGIRIGLFCFVIFSFEGGIMGANMGHHVGAPDGRNSLSLALPFLNWNLQYGDLRIAHFAGMHGLQIIPLLGFYVFKKSWATIVSGLFYFSAVFGLLTWALMGKGWI